MDDFAVTSSTSGKQSGKRRLPSIWRSPSIGADAWNFLRRKTSTSHANNNRRKSHLPVTSAAVSAQKRTSAHGAVGLSLSDSKKYGKSRSMTSLDVMKHLSFRSCDDLTETHSHDEDDVFQKMNATAANHEHDFQLWVRSGKDDPPYPLIGESKIFFTPLLLLSRSCLFLQPRLLPISFANHYFLYGIFAHPCN